MLDLEKIYRDLEAAGLPGWPGALDATIRQRLAPTAHGDLPAWLAAIESLPEAVGGTGTFSAAAVGVDHLELSAEAVSEATNALQVLSPWRKGPFRIGPVFIDSEWRSDLKWARVESAISPLAGRRVLDVGSGNGYYALRMHGADAELVIGVDPTLLYVAQFAAISRFLPPVPVHVLPFRLEELPADANAFDTVFSMGVLYHSRSPIEHLRKLRGALRPGGELVLETLILPGDTAFSRTPESRYARMRNVWHLPSQAELLVWLDRCGFGNAVVADVTATTVDEQRSTDWMTFESLADALHPDDPTRTVEGWPAPLRAIVVAARP